MAKKNIRVEIPTGKPDSMITLSEAITEKHESYSAPAASPAAAAAAEESPLHHINMNAFKEKTALAKTTLASARKMDNEAQDLIQEAHTIMGTAEGQTSETEGTLYFLLDKIRTTLLGDSTGNEEELQKYGFIVVVGQTRGRRTSRIELPIGKPDKFLSLCKDITKKHEAMGAASPLHHLDMEDFKTKTTTAFSKLKEGRKLHLDSDPETEKAYQLIGIGKGQNLQSEGSIYFSINKIKKTLLGFYKGAEEQLQLWGFNVVITTTLPGRKTKRIEVLIAKGASIVVNNVVNGSSATNTGKVPLAIWEGTGPMPPIPVEIDSGISWKVDAPSGTVTIRNFSTTKTGRCKLTVKK